MNKNTYIAFFLHILFLSSCVDKQIPEPSYHLVLVDDLDYVCLFNETIEINPLSNDNISGEVTLVIDEPANGTLTVNQDFKTFTYKPNKGFIGIDVFYYKVCNQVNCESAKIKIQVAPTLDACDENFLARSNSYSIAVNSKFTFSIKEILDNDIACEGDLVEENFKIITNPINGKIEKLNDNDLVYTPNLDYKGEDFIEYEIKSATNPYVKSSSKVYFGVGISRIIE